MDDDAEAVAVGELVTVGELLADVDALAVGDALWDGVGLTDFVGCGLPTGLGDADGCSLDGLACSVDLGCGLELREGVTAGELRCCAVLLPTSPPLRPEIWPVSYTHLTLPTILRV